jgi:hypothetical protein
MNETIAARPDEHRTDMIGAAPAMIAGIVENFRVYGVLPMCRRCRQGCTQYAAPGLTRLECPKGTWTP